MFNTEANATPPRASFPLYNYFGVRALISSSVIDGLIDATATSDMNHEYRGGQPAILG